MFPHTETSDNKVFRNHFYNCMSGITCTCFLIISQSEKFCEVLGYWVYQCYIFSRILDMSKCKKSERMNWMLMML